MHILTVALVVYKKMHNPDTQDDSDSNRRKNYPEIRISSKRKNINNE